MNLFKSIINRIVESEAEYEARQAKHAAKALKNYEELVKLAVLSSLILPDNNHNSVVVKRMAKKILKEIGR